MRVLLMSNDVFGYNAISGIRDSSDGELVGLVTDERTEMSGWTDLRRVAGVPTVDAGESVNRRGVFEFVQSLAPDLILCCGWSRIIGKKLLGAAPHVVGMHPTDLPNGRGCAPVAWSILKDVRVGGVSFFRLVEKIDGGELLLKSTFFVPEWWCASDYFVRVSALVRKMVAELIDFRFGTIELPGGEYLPKRTPVMSQIRWEMGPEGVCRMVRGLCSPYPNAFSYMNGQKVSFRRHSCFVEKQHKDRPGMVVRSDPFSFDVAVGVDRKGIVSFLMEDTDGSEVVEEGRFFEWREPEE